MLPALLVNKTGLLKQACNQTENRARLIALIAPAGYGKTTLLAQWARQLNNPSHRTIWLPLQPGNSRAGLSESLNQALTVCGLLPTGSTDVPADAHRLTAILLNASRIKPFTLFVDGLDNLPRQERDGFIGELFDSLPASCRLAVSSRTELPDRFDLMFANDTAVRVTQESLRFDEDEARTWLGHTASEESTGDAMRLTEGWPVALKLYRELSLRHHGRPVSQVMLADELNRHPTLHTYFNDVLRQQPEVVRTLLCRLSCVDELPAGLVDCLTEPDLPSCTALLLRENLFFTADENQPGFFRLHPLFAAWLRRSQSPEDIRITRSKAIDWLFRNGYYLNAQPYLNTVDSTDVVAQLLIASGGWSLLFRGGPTVARILQSLPLAVVQANPALELARIYRLVQSGEVTLARKTFEELKARTNDFIATPDPFSPTAADGIVMELLLSLYEDRTVGPQALIKAEASLGDDQGDRQSIRPSVIRELLSWSFYHAGNFHKARTIGQESVDLCLRAGIPYVQIYAYLAIGLSELAEGHVSRAAGIYALAETEAIRQFGAECNQVMAAQILGAEILYARNQILSARDVTACWSDAIAEGDGWVDLHASLYRTLSSALRVLGDGPAALNVLEQARRMARERRLWRLDQILENHQLREACLSGDMDRAGIIAQSVRSRHPSSVSMHHQGWRVWFTRLLALARYAFECNDLEACASALHDIDQQLLATPGSHRLCQLERDLLESRMLLAHGGSAWSRPLTRALTLAAESRLLRPILDEGPAMLQMLREHAGTTRLTANVQAFLREVEDAFRPEPPTRAEATLQEDPPSRAAGEPLSKREVDVLALIGEGLTSKEIARRLDISVNTVLTYRKNLHRKLCATTRSQLITIAREQQILTRTSVPPAR